MNEELKQYEQVRDRLMEEFIQDISPWIRWDDISGFEERMARYAIRELIIQAYHAGAISGIESMADYMNSDEVFGNDPASKV